MATAVEAVQTKFQILPLAQITPSPMNPRKRFDEKALKELAASIQAHGVQQPIVVRPHGKPGKLVQFEIVVGERRYRASELAGKTEIPALINSLSDAAALEIMVIENLQREDVHPLDEALGYEALMKKPSETDPELGELPGAPKHTVVSIASRVGKSVKYVYARLKLLALCHAAREAFEADRMTAGHAVLVARLQPLDQILALRAIFEVHGDDREIRKLDAAHLTKLKLADVCDDPYAAIIPEKALREWIQENVNLRLKDVPWDLNNAELVPEAGACANCLKRSASNPGLFRELAVKGEDTCFDAACFKLKREAFVKITLKASKEAAKEHNAKTAEVSGESGEPDVKHPMLQLSELHAYTKAKPDQAVYRQGQWLPAKRGSCDNVREGIMVGGEEAGQRKLVCVEAGCKVHKHNLERALSPSSVGLQHEYEEDNFQRHREGVTGAKRARARGVLAQEIVKRAGAKLPLDFLRHVALEVGGREVERDAGILSWLLGEKKPMSGEQIQNAIRKADDKRLAKLLIAMTLNTLLDSWGDKKDDERDRSALMTIGKSFGVKNSGSILSGADKSLAAAKHCRACGCTEEIPCNYYDQKKNKHVACAWVEGGDLCSNPECVKHEAKVAVKAKAKAATK